MIVEVEMRAFHKVKHDDCETCRRRERCKEHGHPYDFEWDGTIRKVVLPDAKASQSNTPDVLEMVFMWGQNDFQNVPGICSVSVGDVVRLRGKRWRVASIGFKEVGKEDAECIS